MESMIQELYTSLENADSRTSRVLKSRYHVDIASNSKAPFCQLGFNTLARVFSFVQPLETVVLMYVCRVFCKRLKSEFLWKFYVENAVFGKVTFDGIIKPEVADPSFAQFRDKLSDVENYYQFFVENAKVGWQKKQSEMKQRLNTAAGGSDRGLRLFPNASKK
jgi:hypothetical protein